MQNYKDDLLASCLRLVLAAPRELLVVAQLVEPLQLALKMGLSYPPLALVALDAMDKITTRFKLNDLEDACREVLPCLMDYLLVEDGGLEMVKDDGRGRRKALKKGAMPSKPLLIKGSEQRTKGGSSLVTVSIHDLPNPRGRE